jgi:hypothetical protein
MGPNYENSTVVAKGCYWNKRPFSNENEIHTNRPCQTLTYCRQKMVLTLGSTLDRRVEERHALGDCQ